jgi:hypothetical protein
MLGGTLKQEELLSTDVETLLKRLFWEETIRVFDPLHPEFHCTCSREKVGNMLKMLGREEVDIGAGRPRPAGDQLRLLRQALRVRQGRLRPAVRQGRTAIRTGWRLPPAGRGIRRDAAATGRCAWCPRSARRCCRRSRNAAGSPCRPGRPRNAAAPSCRNTWASGTGCSTRAAPGCPGRAAVRARPSRPGPDTPHGHVLHRAVGREGGVDIVAHPRAHRHVAVAFAQRSPAAGPTAASA